MKLSIVLRKTLAGLGVMTVLATLCHARANVFEFGPLVSITAQGAGIRALAIGDMNGDRRADVAVSYGDGRLGVFRQNPSGTLDPPTPEELPFESIRTLKFTDINQDGTDELLVGHWHGLAVYSVDRGWRHMSADSGCEALAVADIDLDGWPDVACHDTTGYVSVYMNDGTGSISVARYILTAAAGNPVGVSVRLADVSGDGAPELLVASLLVPGFYVHPNDGSGGFLPATGYPHPPYGTFLSPSGLEPFDVDGDGVLEIVTSNGCSSPCAALHLYRRNHEGYFEHAGDMETGSQPYWPLTHDVNGDGWPDMVVLHMMYGAIGRYMGGPFGLSRTEILAETDASIDIKSVSLGDINDDGCTDLVVAFSAGLRLRYGDCRRRLGSDYDGDGASDLFWRNSRSGRNLIWWAGDSGLSEPMKTVADLDWQVVGGGDFDGDRRADVLWRNARTGRNVIWHGGAYLEQQSIRSVSDVSWRVVGIGDFDGDNRSDILWRHDSTGANSIWLAGDYAAQQRVTGVSDPMWRVAGIADFNGDGRSDILWRHASRGTNVIWNAGLYAEQLAVRAVTDTRWEVVGVGDFGGDSRADVLWRHASSGRNTSWLSADVNTQRAISGVANADWTVAAVGDYDGDGASDIFWRNATDGRNVIWRNGDSRQQIRVAKAAKEWVVSAN